MPVLFCFLSQPDINTETKTSVGAGVNKPLWSRSDNSFRFNFLADGCPAPQETASPAAGHAEASSAHVSFTGQGSDFAFNFQIPPASDDVNMDTEEGKPAVLQEGVQSEAKTKKKKSGKKKASDVEVNEKAAEEQVSVEYLHLVKSFVLFEASLDLM